MKNNVVALDLIGTGFPPNEGEHLAQRLLRTRDEIDWKNLTVDLRECQAGMLISAFFNSFLQHIHEESPELLKDARSITWTTDFEFQAEKIRDWVEHFRPQHLA